MFGTFASSMFVKYSVAQIAWMRSPTPADAQKDGGTARSSFFEAHRKKTQMELLHVPSAGIGGWTGGGCDATRGLMPCRREPMFSGSSCSGPASLRDFIVSKGVGPG